MRQTLLSIRPDILSIDQEAQSGAIESFQNRTLRPILKFQHTLILSIFQGTVQKYKTDINALTDKKRNELIEQIIQKDNKLRNLLIGVVIGLFTDKEWQEYESHEKELNKRIIDLLIQRIQDQLKS